MWALVERYTGKVGYRRGVKSEGLLADPPMIDCSGWSSLVLTSATEAQNKAADRLVFEPENISAIHCWSDRIVQEIETRTGRVIHGEQVTAANLPRCAAIGIKQGAPEWAKNYPRSRGTTHIVQVVRRPADDAPLVSESLGCGAPHGVRLTPLHEWLDLAGQHVYAGEIWAVDPFAMARTPS